MFHNSLVRYHHKQRTTQQYNNNYHDDVQQSQDDFKRDKEWKYCTGSRKAMVVDVVDDTSSHQDPKIPFLPLSMQNRRCAENLRAI